MDFHAVSVWGASHSVKRFPKGKPTKPELPSPARSGASRLSRCGHAQTPHTGAEDLLDIIVRRHERFSTLLTSNRPVEDSGKLLGDVAALGAMLGRLLHMAMCSIAVRAAGVRRLRSEVDNECCPPAVGRPSLGTI